MEVKKLPERSNSFSGNSSKSMSGNSVKVLLAKIKDSKLRFLLKRLRGRPLNWLLDKSIFLRLSEVASKTVLSKLLK